MGKGFEKTDKKRLNGLSLEMFVVMCWNIWVLARVVAKMFIPIKRLHKHPREKCKGKGKILLEKKTAPEKQLQSVSMNCWKSGIQHWVVKGRSKKGKTE